jgi:hypothetical protein
MLGGGLPSAEQSMRAPVSFAKSTRDGGSFRKDGPTNDAAAVGIGEIIAIGSSVSNAILTITNKPRNNSYRFKCFERHINNNKQTSEALGTKTTYLKNAKLFLVTILVFSPKDGAACILVRGQN